MRRAGARRDAYLPRLIRQGFKVAICEQLEDPAEARKRGAQVARRARRGAHRHARHAHRGRAAGSAQQQLPAALCRGAGQLGARLGRRLDRRVRDRGARPGSSPAGWHGWRRASCWCPTGCWRRERRRPCWRSRSPPDAAARPASTACRARSACLQVFEVDDARRFGAFARAEIGACGALVDYLELTQKGLLPRSGRRAASAPRLVQIDPATRRNLELTGASPAPRGQPAGDHRPHGDRPGCAAARRAARRAAGRTRVESAAGSTRWQRSSRRPDVRADARRAAPYARPGARARAPGAGAGRSARPAAMRDGLDRARRGERRCAGGPEVLCRRRRRRGLRCRPAPLVAALAGRAGGQPPLLARDGGLVRGGVSAGARRAAHLARREPPPRRRPGGALSRRDRRRHAQDPSQQPDRLLHRGADRARGQGTGRRFVQRQGMAGAIRYSTEELAELESRIAAAADRALALELEIFERAAPAGAGRGGADRGARQRRWRGST